MKRLIALCTILTLMILTACWNNKKWVDKCNDELPATISYSLDIAPIIQTHCNLTDNNCHSASGLGGPMGTYPKLSGWCFGSPPIILGDINWQTNPMPKGKPQLSACEIAKITKWIDQGYPNN